MTTSYYPGGGVMIATDPGAVYAELDAQDKMLWDRESPDAVGRIERELLRRSLSRRLERYQIIDADKQLVVDGVTVALRERYSG